MRFFSYLMLASIVAMSGCSQSGGCRTPLLNRLGWLRGIPRVDSPMESGCCGQVTQSCDCAGAELVSTIPCPCENEAAVVFDDAPEYGTTVPSDVSGLPYEMEMSTPEEYLHLPESEAPKLEGFVAPEEDDNLDFVAPVEDNEPELDALTDSEQELGENSILNSDENWSETQRRIPALPISNSKTLSEPDLFDDVAPVPFEKSNQLELDESPTTPLPAVGEFSIDPVVLRARPVQRHTVNDNRVIPSPFSQVADRRGADRYGVPAGGTIHFQELPPVDGTTRQFEPYRGQESGTASPEIDHPLPEVEPVPEASTLSKTSYYDSESLHHEAVEVESGESICKICGGRCVKLTGTTGVSDKPNTATIQSAEHVHESVSIPRLHASLPGNFNAEPPMARISLTRPVIDHGRYAVTPPVLKVVPAIDNQPAARTSGDPELPLNTVER